MARRSTKAQQAIDEHVGSRLREIRKARGMSLQKVSDLVGVTYQQIQKYERGNDVIAPSKLYQLAEGLDVPVSFFFDGLRTGKRAA